MRIHPPRNMNCLILEQHQADDGSIWVRIRYPDNVEAIVPFIEVDPPRFDDEQE
jgi:hypothetical protein